jgi:glyoxylase-like metal-dependent hydrolase (beta-lactamase superfamily II)
MDETSVAAVLEGIKRITDKPIRFLVNTHSDGDHVNGNRFFPASILIIAHENCRKEMLLPKRDGTPSDWSAPEFAPFLPAITFRDRMDLRLGLREIQLWYFGVGHTTGDVVVYFPDEKTAFVGDQVFSGRPQLIHSYKGGDSFEHVKTLERMLETLDAEKFCTGHSDILDRAAIRKHIDGMKTLQETVRSMKTQGKTLDEIKAAFAAEKTALVETIVGELERP